MLLPLLLLLLTLFLHSAAASADTATLQPVHPVPPTPSTIPAFPKQSATTSSSCPLTLPLSLLPPSLRPSCSPSSCRLRCCPALATLLFSSYPLQHPSSSNSTRAVVYDMPEVPEDSEEVGKALRDSGVAVSYRNASCDHMFCYCEIRLHRLSCDMDDGLFYNRVGSLARDCSSPRISGCSKCLTSLFKLTSIGKDTAASDSSNEEDRTTKMHDQDCQLMALAWLLSKNHSAYAPTVTTIFRAMMSTPDGSNPKSCTLSSDGLPLAVDSSEVSGNSSPPTYALPWSAVVGSMFPALVCSFHFWFLVI